MLMATVRRLDINYEVLGDRDPPASDARRRTEPVTFMAEREGFEPSVPR
jgi:hypothetical protein